MVATTTDVPIVPRDWGRVKRDSRKLFQKFARGAARPQAVAAAEDRSHGGDMAEHKHAESRPTMGGGGLVMRVGRGGRMTFEKGAWGDGGGDTVQLFIAPRAGRAVTLAALDIMRADLAEHWEALAVAGRDAEGKVDPTFVPKQLNDLYAVLSVAEAAELDRCIVDAVEGFRARWQAAARRPATLGEMKRASGSPVTSRLGSVKSDEAKAATPRKAC